MVATNGMRPLKVGFLLYTREERMGGTTPRWSDLRSVARQAEQAGVRLDLAGRPLRHDVRERPRFRTASGSAGRSSRALAAMTERVRGLGTVVSGGGFRNPALVAKMAGTVEEISDGRLILGIGAGYHDLGIYRVRLPDHGARSRASRRPSRSFTRCCAPVTSMSRAGTGRPVTANCAREVHDYKVRPS